MKIKQVQMVALVISMLLLLSSCRSSLQFDMDSLNYPVNQSTLIKDAAQMSPPEAVDGQTMIAQKGYLALYTDMTAGHFQIMDLRDGQKWSSIPSDADQDETAQGITRTVLKSEVVIDIVDLKTKTISTATSFASCEAEGSIAVAKGENGFNVVYDFKTEGIKIPVAYKLMEDGIRVQINTEKIVESNEIQLLGISVLPMFGAKNQTQSGYFLLANGSGSIMNFNNKKNNTHPFKEKVYGDDPVYQQDKKVYFKENYSLPVYGMQAGDHGLFAVADLGAANASVNAASSGQISNYNTAYFSFDIRGYDTVSIGDKSTWNYKDVMTFEDGAIQTGKAGVRYFLLGKEQAGIPAMASLMRDYMKTDSGFKKTDIPDTAPIYLSVLGSMKRTASMLGIQYSKTEKVTTIKQASEMADQLKNKGVSGITMLYDNWSKSLIDNKITNSFDLIGNLGSKKELVGLGTKLQNTGGGLGLVSELIRYSQDGNGISKNNDCIKDISKKPVSVGVYKRNTQFPDPKKTAGRIVTVLNAVNSFNHCISAFNQKNIPAGVVLGSMSNSLYSDYGNGGMKRQASEQIIRQMVAASRDKISMIGL